MKSILKKALIISAICLAFAPLANAAELLGPASSQGDVTLGATQTKTNLYMAGGNVLVNGQVKKDLTLAGGQVTVVGDVERELILIGGDVNLSGKIGDTARVAAGNIVISGPIGSDLAVVGGNVHLLGKSSVGGDLLMAGGTLDLETPVLGNARIFAGDVYINSKISGDLNIRASGVLKFGPLAEVTGKIFYKGPKPAVVDQGAKLTDINYTVWERPNAKGAVAGLLTLGFLVKLLALFLTLVVLFGLKKLQLNGLMDSIKNKPWANLGWGFVYLIISPLLAILLFLTLVGYYAGFIILFLYALALVLAKVLAAAVLGFIIMRMLFKQPEAPVWQPILIGVVAWYLLALIPVLGFLVLAIVFLMTLGALGQSVLNFIKN